MTILLGCHCYTCNTTFSDFQTIISPQRLSPVHSSADSTILSRENATVCKFCVCFLSHHCYFIKGHMLVFITGRLCLAISHECENVTH